KWWIITFSVITVIWLWLIKENPWIIFFLIATNIGGGLLNSFLKHSFERERPEINPGIDTIGFSFPSGHAMGAMIFYGFIGYILIRSQRRKRIKLLLSVILILFIF